MSMSRTILAVTYRTMPNVALVMSDVSPGQPPASMTLPLWMRLEDWKCRQGAGMALMSGICVVRTYLNADIV